MTEFSNRDDVIDIRDVIARFEELTDTKANTAADVWASHWQDDEDELNLLATLLDDLQGTGGDEQWRGDWYPVTMIRDSHFKAYAEELAEDCGMIQAGATWPNNCIDWDEAARQLKFDYTSVEFDGVTYWVR